VTQRRQQTGARRRSTPRQESGVPFLPKYRFNIPAIDDIDSPEDPLPLAILAFRLGFFTRYIWTSKLTSTLVSLDRHGIGEDVSSLLALMDEINRDYRTERLPEIEAASDELFKVAEVNDRRRRRPSVADKAKLAAACARLRVARYWQPTYEQRQRMKKEANKLLPVGHDYRGLYQLGACLGGSDKQLVLKEVTDTWELITRLKDGIRDAIERGDSYVVQLAVLRRIVDVDAASDTFSAQFYGEVLGLPQDERGYAFINGPHEPVAITA
jgi:hypothetical protein